MGWHYRRWYKLADWDDLSSLCHPAVEAAGEHPDMYKKYMTRNL
jgi:hypothetical protein